ncbi:MAG: hypothetical protein HY534_08225 [Chloroflexi bacterium]|nr:hypothetical protein [Chloroflexota bacterium]
MITGARRSWLRGGRTEPFAACLSIRGERDGVQDLVGVAHSAFQGSAKRSLTSGLTRALLAVHTVLLQESREQPDAEPGLASGVAAALRPSGLYLAQMGDGLFGNTRLGTLWARTWEADEGALETMGEEPTEALPRVTTEFFPISPGDAFLLLPGLNGGEVAGEWLGAALEASPDLDAIGELLAHAPSSTAGLVVWWPPDGQDRLDRRWITWTSAPASRRLPTAAPPQPTVSGAETLRGPATEDQPLIRTAEPVPPLAEARPTPEPSDLTRAEQPSGTEPVRIAEVAFQGVPQRRWPRSVAAAGMPAGRSFWLGAAATIAVVGLAVAAIARNAGPDTTVEDGAALIRQAESLIDRDLALATYDQAIARLQSKADRDVDALKWLTQAQAGRGRVLDVIHVSDIALFGLPSSEHSRPLGLWQGENSLFILDVGQQLLYRSDVEGDHLEVALKPGDTHADQPLGGLVAGAWSPPQGVNTDGRLMLVDTARSILSISPSGTRRWWPPDADQWERIGPIAATYENLFLLDTGRGLVWQYPARVALARATTAATSANEPRMSQAIDMATDGNLYFLLPDGSIRKLAPGGGSLPFEGRVPGQALVGPVAVFAHPDLDRIWVLDPPASRVVEFTNGGAYARQYVFPRNVIIQGKSLQIDPAVEEMRVLTSDRVLSVKMRPGGTTS